ncbi:hypothetical protein P692DRAFT_20831650 [Suillus brevipes Sb2]|nr:hypothetical protein P692DRAFT_20831650 [Suillus brevipes Sb2]
MHAQPSFWWMSSLARSQVLWLLGSTTPVQIASQLGVLRSRPSSICILLRRTSTWRTRLGKYYLCKPLKYVPAVGTFTKTCALYVFQMHFNRHDVFPVIHFGSLHRCNIVPKPRERGLDPIFGGLLKRSVGRDSY